MGNQSQSGIPTITSADFNYIKKQKNLTTSTGIEPTTFWLVA
jgi:hypothetical protein